MRHDFYLSVVLCYVIVFTVHFLLVNILFSSCPLFGDSTVSESTIVLYVGMVQDVSNSQYIGIGTKTRKASKNAKTRLRRAKYEIFIH